MSDEIEHLELKLAAITEQMVKATQEISRLETIAESLRCPALVENKALRASQRAHAAELARDQSEVQETIAMLKEQAQELLAAKLAAHDEALNIDMSADT